MDSFKESDRSVRRVRTHGLSFSTICWTVLWMVMPLVLSAQSATMSEAQKDFFENKIRPLLANQCFACHTNSQLGGLRLESRESILAGGKSGPAVVPGDPDKSLLIIAVRRTGTLQMPKGASPLSSSQIADLTQWVKDGAYWPAESASAHVRTITAAQRRFWSIQPLHKPEPPKVRDTSWPANEIDRFVLARLEKDGLKPAPVADRRTLLRRVTYDLTGLPPTYEEVKAFEADKSANAYGKVVDRLLASPRYGETWARHWMDVVRYGEDDYRISKRPDRVERYPFAYTYRDWLIKSLNEDVSYDFFVKAQIAGDLLDEKVREKAIPGLGMNGLGVWQWVANIAQIERADEWNDKVDITTKAFLGLTVGCARCHDHKYDPIPTKDYYRLAGVFASSPYHEYPLAPKSVIDDYQDKKKELEDKEESLKKLLDQISDIYAKMLFAQTEDYMVAAWKVGAQKGATVASVAEDSRLDVEILGRWMRFLKKKPTNYSYLKPWQEMVASKGNLDRAKTLAHDFYQKAAEIEKEHAKIKEENELTLAKLKDPNEAFDPLPNGLKRELTKYAIELKSLDREKIYLWRDMFDTDLAEFNSDVDNLDKPNPGLLKLTGWTLEKRMSADWAAQVARFKTDIEAFKKAMPEHYPFVYGLGESKEPTNLKVYLRGSPFAFGDDAPRAFLSMLSDGEPKPFTKGSGRLELAEDIVKQPIATRVIVNRLWRWHMGSGLVDTPNNFGLVGERPSNPELLEYLAAQFADNGMSWKKLHKEIVMSKTYRLATTEIQANTAKDPDNRLYWRGNRRRLQAEGIWDSLLIASGELDLSKTGGPSQDLDLSMERRGVYGAVSRMYPNEYQLIFDFPTPTTSAERRYTTHVPQQRLFFLNSDIAHHRAAALANRVKSAGSESDQVKMAFEIVYQRLPNPVELALMLETMHAPSDAPPQTAMPTASGIAMKPEASSIAAAVPAKESPLESVCWALLSSNEFLYVD
jgi:Protein of unknown function (DUF1549)/Protein of unknown function (DUF1553)/Planctomycete cytochrome C